jgi:RNA polymerase sigma-32 factor
MEDIHLDALGGNLDDLAIIVDEAFAKDADELSYETNVNRRPHFPNLAGDEEFALVKRAKDGDFVAREKLFKSYQKLVRSIAQQLCHSPQDLEDLVSIGNIGLSRALERFDPDKGFRFGTYARSSIRGEILKHALRSWSLVNDTTTAEKKLFFVLRKIRNRLGVLHDNDLHPDQVKWIAAQVGVTDEDVVCMNRRLMGDSSLNASISNDTKREEWQDFLIDGSMDQETTLADTENRDIRREILTSALNSLNPRERRVFEARRLVEEPLTLKELSEEMGISGERVRQIEARAFEKVQKAVKAQEPSAMPMAAVCKESDDAVTQPRDPQPKPDPVSSLHIRPRYVGKNRFDNPRIKERNNRSAYYRDFKDEAERRSWSQSIWKQPKHKSAEDFFKEASKEQTDNRKKKPFKDRWGKPLAATIRSRDSGAPRNERGWKEIGSTGVYKRRLPAVRHDLVFAEAA